jgi:hypothetical protein
MATQLFESSSFGRRYEDQCLATSGLGKRGIGIGKTRRSPRICSPLTSVTADRRCRVLVQDQHVAIVRWDKTQVSCISGRQAYVSPLVGGSAIVGSLRVGIPTKKVSAGLPVGFPTKFMEIPA